MNKLHCQLLPYGAALGAVLLAAFLARLLLPLTATASPLLLAAVTVSSLYGGLGPGLVATVLSALALDVLVLHSVYSHLTGFAEATRLGVFGLVAVLISSLYSARRRGAGPDPDPGPRACGPRPGRGGQLLQGPVFGLPEP